MRILLATITFLNLFAAALVAGGQLVFTVAVVPAARRMDERASLQLHQELLDHRAERHMPIATVTTMVTAIGIIALDFAATGRVVLTAVGLVCMVGVTLITVNGNMPLNTGLRGLSAPPDDYPDVRRRWDRLHNLRALCGTAGLVVFIVAALLG